MYAIYSRKLKAARAPGITDRQTYFPFLWRPPPPPHTTTACTLCTGGWTADLRRLFASLETTKTGNCFLLSRAPLPPLAQGKGWVPHGLMYHCSSSHAVV